MKEPNLTQMLTCREILSVGVETIACLGAVEHPGPHFNYTKATSGTTRPTVKWGDDPLVADGYRWRKFLRWIKDADWLDHSAVSGVYEKIGELEVMEPVDE